MNKYLFLDIDGVLNDETVQHENGVHGMNPTLVARLNQIIDATDPKIVISSSWRRDVHRGHMTIKGLERMLMRFGINCQYRLDGITEPDDYVRTRGQLISAWIDANLKGRYRYLILDDGAYWLPGQEDHGIRAAGHGSSFVQTDYRIGLTDRDVSKAISILNSKTASSLIRS